MPNRKIGLLLVAFLAAKNGITELVEAAFTVSAEAK